MNANKINVRSRTIILITEFLEFFGGLSYLLFCKFQECGDYYGIYMLKLLRGEGFGDRNTLAYNNYGESTSDIVTGMNVGEVIFC